MRKLRITAEASILLIAVFMVIGLLRYNEEDEVSLIQDSLEYYLEEDWREVSLGGAGEAGSGGGDVIPRRVEEALAAGDYVETGLPYQKEGGGTAVLANTLPGEAAGLTLGVTARGADVRVYLDGGLLYGQSAQEEMPGKSGNGEIFVNIPREFEEGELWIELVPLASQTAVSLEAVKVETRDMMVIRVVEGRISEVGACVLILLMSIILFVLALIRRYTRYPARGEMFLGLAGMASGIYCFIDTDSLSIFYDMQEAYEAQEYLALMVPLFLALYFDRNLRERYPRRFAVLLWGMIANAAAQIFLHTLGVQNLAQMAAVSAIAVAAVCVAAVVSLIQLDYSKRQYKTVLAVLAMGVLFAGVLLNIFVGAFLGYRGNHAAGRYSMAIFCVMMALMHTLQLSKEYRAAAEENARLLAEQVKAAQEQNAALALAKREADEARHEAQAANEAKGKFLARMSHEIRTPINAVLGMDEMILRESGEPQIKEYAMDIYTAGQTLLSLINDILDFSKIDSGKMEILPVEYDVSSLIHDLANMASQRAKDKKLRLEVEVDPRIPSRLYGDDVRIRQVLTNILTNAVKYTHEGTVRFRAGRLEEAGAGAASGGFTGPEAESRVVLAFEVEDTGIGIREEDLPRLAAEFERIEEDRNRHIEGTGLGMNITIQLLSLMGSRLQVESVYGEGSKFSFNLEQGIVDPVPVGNFESRVRQMTEQYKYNTKFSAPEAEVLVVDDNGVNRKVFRNLLKETGIRVTEAGGGVECLELVREHHYDLIFLDHMMPGMDGVETLHRLRELTDCPCRDTPVVVLTANAVAGAKERYLAEGFDDFLSKPIVPGKLEGMIKKMLPKELVRETAEDGERTVGEDPGGSLNAGGHGGAECAGAGSSGGSLGPDELPQVDGLDWQYAWLHLPDLELLEYTVKEFYAQINSAGEKLEGFYASIEAQSGPVPGAEEGQSGPALGAVEIQSGPALGAEEVRSGPAMDTMGRDSSGPLEQYRIQVHAMKSLAATVGFVSLSGLAKVLEAAAGSGKIEVLRSLTHIFLEEWRGCRRKLEGVFGIEDAAGKEVTDYGVMRAYVEMLRLSMQELDIDQADQLMCQLREYEYPEEIDANIRKLGEAVTNLDPEEADRLGEILIEQMGVRQSGAQRADGR